MSNNPTIRVGETDSGPGDNGLAAGQPVALPIENILTGRAFATGKSGSGKSNSVGVVCERLLERGYPLFIVDIEGEHYTLKEEFEVLHIGGDDECDLQVGPEHAEKIAGLALEESLPVVLDLSTYIDEDRRDEVVAEFAKHLFAKEKTVRRPFLLIVEEIHEFVPEKGSISECGKMLIRIAKRGRKRGLGLWGLSQRPANVKKDYITQCDILLWHRLTWNNDTRVVRDILGKEYADAIEDLNPGEGYLQADFLDDPEVRRLKMDRKETFDAGATPGLDDVDRPEVESLSDDLAAELDEISQETERRQSELDRVKAERDELQEDVDELQERVDRLLDFREMFERAEGGDASVFSQQETVTIELEGEGIEVPETLQAEVLEIRERKEELSERLEQIKQERDKLQQTVDDLQAELNQRAAPEEFASLRDDVAELMHRHADILDIEASQKVEQLKDRVTTLEEEKKELEQRTPPEIDDITELLSHDVIQELIESTADGLSYSNAHAWDAIMAMAESDEWLAVDQISPFTGISQKSTANLLRPLSEQLAFVERKQGGSKRVLYRLNTEAMRAEISKHNRKEQIKQSSQEVRPGGNP